MSKVKGGAQHAVHAPKRELTELLLSEALQDTQLRESCHSCCVVQIIPIGCIILAEDGDGLLMRILQTRTESNFIIITGMTASR